MKLGFELHCHPGDLDAEDEILNALNDDGLRACIEGALVLAIKSAVWFDRKINVGAKLVEWDVK